MTIILAVYTTFVKNNLVVQDFQPIKNIMINHTRQYKIYNYGTGIIENTEVPVKYNESVSPRDKFSHFGYYYTEHKTSHDVVLVCDSDSYIEYYEFCTMFIEFVPAKILLIHRINAVGFSLDILYKKPHLNLTNDYELIYCKKIDKSDIVFEDENESEYHLLKYRKTNIKQELLYNNLLNTILENGNIRHNRTGIDTLSIFGGRMEFDITRTIPLVTTRNISFKIIVEELLLFCRGDTDVAILQEKGIHIWDGNTSRDFLDKCGLTHYPENILGAGYGWQWRHFGAEYSIKYANTIKLSQEERNSIGGYDQLESIINLLKTDPTSRRIVLSAWNPADFDKTALVPCHFIIQFYVEFITINDKSIPHLSCKFNMRSSDSLAWSFNIVSYTLLTYILAAKCNMVPYKIIYESGDCHIYVNHIEQIKHQLSNSCRPFPALILNKDITTKDWHDMKYEDFELYGYFPNKSKKMSMAI